MSPSSQEQRNIYKGNPACGWFHIQLVAPDGTLCGLDAIADTGNPFFLIVGTGVMQRFQHRRASNVVSNYGLLQGSFIHVRIPEIGLNRSLLVYGNDNAIAAVQASSPDFNGLAGLLLLRLGEYGGNATHFWIRAAAGFP